MIELLLLGWTACGIVAAGISAAYFQRKFLPELAEDFYAEDLGASLLIGILGGPVSVVVAFLLFGFGKYGWTLMPPRKKGRG